MILMKKILLTVFAAAALGGALSAQNYPAGLIDKTVAVVGNEMISIGQIENELMYRKANGMASDASMRCEILESMLEAKLFLMQAWIDSLTVNQDMVSSALTQRIDQFRQGLGVDDQVE